MGNDLDFFFGDDTVNNSERPKFRRALAIAAFGG
jgi:hypothetical protein